MIKKIMSAAIDPALAFVFTIMLFAFFAFLEHPVSPVNGVMLYFLLSILVKVHGLKP